MVRRPGMSSIFLRTLTIVSLVLFVVSGLVSVMNLNQKTVKAATNNVVNFQARILQANGAVVADGAYNVEFKIYDASSGGNLLWTETYTGGDKIVTKNGYVTTALGTVHPFDNHIPNWSSKLYLSLNIGGTGAPSWDGEMNPRMLITAVPHALSSEKLQVDNGTYTTTLNFTSPTGGNQSFVLPDLGGASSATIISTGNLNSITGVGTLTSGTWNANAIGTGYGGTGLTSYTTGDLLYASGTNVLNKLAAVASGSCLISNGVGTAPTWGSCGGGGSGVTLVGTLNSQTKSADGAVISGTSIYMQTADATYPGLVSTTTQTFAGDKTFNGTVTLVSTLAVQGATITVGTNSQRGSLVLNDGSNNTTTLQSSDISGNLTFKFPTGYGTSGDCITGDGAGGLAFSSTCGSGSGGAPTGASYLTLSNDSTLSAERVLTAGTNVGFTDGGGNSTLTIKVVDNPTFSGLVTGQAGLTVTGAAVSLNNNSNFDVSLNTGSSTGNINIGGGSSPLTINSTNFDVSSAGALSGITTISTSSTINSQTISSAANFTGTLAVQGASVTIGTASTTNGTLVLQNNANAYTVTLSGAGKTTNSTVLAIPATAAANDTICLQSFNNCSGTGANTNLSNLGVGTVAINTSLVSDTDNTDDLGSAAISWRDVYSRSLKLDGATSGTITLQAAATAGTNTITLPAATGTVALLESAQTWTGAQTFANSTSIPEQSDARRDHPRLRHASVSSSALDLTRHASPPRSRPRRPAAHRARGICSVNSARTAMSSLFSIW